MSIRSTLPGTQDKNGLDAQRTVIHELRRIKTAIIQGTSGNGSATAANQTTMIASLTAIDALLTTIDTSSTNIELYNYRSNWDVIAGNSIEFTYYVGVEAGNPSGLTTNLKTSVYKTGASAIFTQTIAYNATDKIISITTS